MKKVVVIGPESTGKSTLASQLARHYHTAWVPEFAREYLEQLERPYTQLDILQIAKGQVILEEQKEKEADQLLICDTDLIVCKIWSEYKYGNVHPWILEQVRGRHYDLHLLMDIDLPWQPDPQREHPQMREHFLEVYQNELAQWSVRYETVSGSENARFERAVGIIDGYFG